MIEFKEPYYLVEFNSSIVNFEIFINDIPAFIHHSGGAIFSHVPINHFILESGKQNIKINILPLKGNTNLKEDGFVKIKVFCYDSSTTNYENTIEAFRFEKVDFSEDNLPIKNLIKEFNADVNYKIEGWKNSTLLKDNLNKEEIKKYFKGLHTAFKEKNIENIFHEMKNKFNEVDMAIYLGNVDNKTELSQLFANLESGRLILEDFPTSTQIELFGNNRICTLTRIKDVPIIYYKNKETNEEFSFPIFLHKKLDNNSFEIIR